MAKGRPSNRNGNNAYDEDGHRVKNIDHEHDVIAEHEHDVCMISMLTDFTSIYIG